MKKSVQPFNGSPLHVAAAWLFLVAAIVSGVVGVYRMMSPVVTDTIAGSAAVVAQRGGDCLCLGVLLGIIAAVLALLGIHRQMGVMFAIGPTFQGSSGSGDDK